VVADLKLLLVAIVGFHVYTRDARCQSIATERLSELFSYAFPLTVLLIDLLMVG